MLGIFELIRIPVGMALLLFGVQVLSGGMAKVVGHRLQGWLVPQSKSEQEPQLTRYIDQSQLRFPRVAMQGATRELSHVVRKTADMLERSRRALAEKDAETAQQVVQMDEMFQHTHRIYTMAQRAVRDDDYLMAELARRLGEELDRRYGKARKKLDKRIKRVGLEDQDRAVYLEMLPTLEGINHHADSIITSVLRDMTPPPRTID